MTGSDDVNAVTEYAHAEHVTTIKVRQANWGNPLRIEDLKGLVTSASYDDFGKKLSLSDPSRGPWSFTYNGLGEMLSQTDARGLVTALTYDVLGRVILSTAAVPRRDGTGNASVTESTRYQNTPGVSYGTVIHSERKNGEAPLIGPVRNPEHESAKRAFAYDPLGRVLSTTLSIDTASGLPTTTLTESQVYDSRYGRVKQTHLPASATGPVSTYVRYDAFGFPVREGFATDYLTATPDSSLAYRHQVTVNARGQGTEMRYGSGVPGGSGFDLIGLANYDPNTGTLLGHCVNSGTGSCGGDSIPTGASNQALDMRYRYDAYGNVKQQVHAGRWGNSSLSLASENYSYDVLMRMTQSSRTTAGTPSSETVGYRYDEMGHLLEKSDYSNSNTSCSISNLAACAYSYSGHKVGSVSRAGGTNTFGYDLNGNITTRTVGSAATQLAYDENNLPTRISKPGFTQDYYSFGGRYRQQLKQNGSSVRDTLYLNKSYEKETAASGSTERYYLTEGVMLLVQSGQNGQNIQRELHYQHGDRLGSTVSVTIKNLSTGDLTAGENRGFDAFGKARDGQWGNTNNGLLWAFLPGQSYHTAKPNQRGFTGHEHLDEFELTHMNGRIYDYNLGRFYGVDPFIQFPANSQSLNPYAYLMNNPLSGTDPSGYAACGETIANGEVCTVEVKQRVQETGSRIVRTESKTYTVGANGANLFIAAGAGKNAELSVRAVVSEINSASERPVVESQRCIAGCHQNEPDKFDMGLAALNPRDKQVGDVAAGLLPVSSEISSFHELATGRTLLGNEETSRVWGLIGVLTLGYAKRADEFVDLYHGTTKANAKSIREGGIDLSLSRTDLDFGKGFYTTQDIGQAAKWASRAADGGEVLHFRVSLRELDRFRSQNFAGADRDWLAFVRGNRNGDSMHSYDIVSGPMLGNPGQLKRGATASSFGQQTSFHTQSIIDLLNGSLGP